MIWSEKSATFPDHALAVDGGMPLAGGTVSLGDEIACREASRRPSEAAVNGCRCELRQ
jgi:hypothetical protein